MHINNNHNEHFLNTSSVSWRNRDPSLYKLFFPLWGGLIQNVKRLLVTLNDDNFIRQDLKKHKIPEENIAEAITITKNKIVEEKELYDLIKNAPNNNKKYIS